MKESVYPEKNKPVNCHSCSAVYSLTDLLSLAYLFSKVDIFGQFKLTQKNTAE